MRNNGKQTSIFAYYLKTSRIHNIIKWISDDVNQYNFNSNGHLSTDIQVYNERQSNQKNIIVGKTKTTVAFLYFCKYKSERP